eukprot:779222-Amphidinium_carterae.1
MALPRAAAHSNKLKDMSSETFSVALHWPTQVNRTLKVLNLRRNALKARMHRMCLCICQSRPHLCVVKSLALGEVYAWHTLTPPIKVWVVGR